MSKLGLNVGSGQRPFTSTPEVTWINIDSVVRNGLKPDVVADGAHIPRSVALDATVDYFVLHHVLEHFGCGDGQALITEAHRVLTPGGSLLVFVPDMQALAIRWVQGQMDTQLYMTNVYGAYMGDEADRHKWGYSYKSLFEFLGPLGRWHARKAFDWRPIPGADIARDWWIIGIECVR